jgi:transposase
MAKYKYYDYSQDVLIPVSLEKQLVAGSLEFAIHYLVETRMDTSIFDDRYRNDETGRCAYDPKVLLKVVLLGYSRGLIGSRKIERACKENVTFMALSCGQQPDHSTIAAFVSSMKGEILPLFRDVLLVCEEENLLGGTFFALDGCKLSSNASSECSGTISDLERKKARIEAKVKGLLEEQVEKDKKDDDDEPGGGSSGLSNRNRQIERLKEKAERIEKFLKENGPKIGKQGREIKSNITDNESATMFTSHGVIQGYNGQAFVDNKHQVIVHGEAFGSGDDERSLVGPMLDGAKANMGALGKGEEYFKGKTFTADGNYHGPANLKTCQEEGLDAYIPDKDFRKRDPLFHGQHKRRRKKAGRFTLEDFQYDEKADEYICPNGKRLKLRAKGAVVTGVIYRRYATKKAFCMSCELKARCMKGRVVNGRCLSVPVGSVPGNLSKAMAAKIDSERGRKIYPLRLAVVEPVFANIRARKRLDHFTLRGKRKVNIQWVLYCMVHNIEKILKYGFSFGFT